MCIRKTHLPEGEVAKQRIGRNQNSTAEFLHYYIDPVCSCLLLSTEMALLCPLVKEQNKGCPKFEPNQVSETGWINPGIANHCVTTPTPKLADCTIKSA